MIQIFSKKTATACLMLAACLLVPAVALASPHGGAPAIDGSVLSGWWALPFACMLLSIALGPILIPSIWHHHFGKIAFGWGLAFLIPYAIFYGVDSALYEAFHALVLEYEPFIVLLFALFTISGGIRVTGSLAGTPAVNTGIILIGTILASWMGTTGAAMLLIRPLMRANAHRKHKVHTVIFFIFLVANIGGSLTPLGDPPLFLGFLKGVEFFWTLQHIWIQTLFMVAVLIPVYFIYDTIMYRREGAPTLPGEKQKLGLEGKINFLFLAGVVGAVLMSGAWRPGVQFEVYHLHLELQNICRDAILLALAGLSWVATKKEVREANEFNWEPIQEVAKVFLGIFLSMIPAIAILRAGENGALRDLVAMVSTSSGDPIPAAYFWLTGALSSFLDNAPTYLVFFNTAGGDPVYLMNEVTTLAAVSIGAVFMGANTYIGNAPNFMVRSIAQSMGTKMPSFFAYFAIAMVVLGPLYLLITWLFL
ncbi:MAG: sodium:proton antiporter [Desulfovibrionaceae bacterium]|nr:sodium:proton antiporter [Desulfovibrionaceae bacterium]